MQTHTELETVPVWAHADRHFGGDQSPLNDADADEDFDPEGELDLDILGLDEFSDSDKLDVGSSMLG